MNTTETNSISNIKKSMV